MQEERQAASQSLPPVSMMLSSQYIKGIMAPAQVPFLSGIEAARQGIARDGLPRMARKFVAGLHDRARAAVGLSPGYLKVRTGCRAMLIVLRSFPRGYLGVAVVP